MLGFGNVLKSSCTPQPPITSQRLKVDADVTVNAVLSPGEQGKTGHFITPMEGEMKSGGKGEEVKGEVLALPPQPADEVIPEQPQAPIIQPVVPTVPEEKQVERIPTVPLQEIAMSEENRVMTASQGVRERPVPSQEPQQDVMLNAYYETPVTNPYLELMKTQEQGRVPIAEPPPIEEDAPPDNPREAFVASSPEVAS